MAECYDLIVIGAGPGGYLPAIRAAKAGKRTAVIDRGYPGGTCLNCGCIPTKTYLHTAELYREVSGLGKAGLTADALAVDMKTLKARKDQVVEELRAGILKQFQMNKIDFYQGTAVVESEHQVRVYPEMEDLKGKSEYIPEGTACLRENTEQFLNGTYILVASGSKPLIPPIPGAILPGIDTSATILDRDSLYEHLIIVGGGVIGMEFATIYSSLGCRVTVLEAMDRILPGMDKEISQNLKMILKKRGVSIHTGAMVKNLAQRDNGYCCTYAEKETEETVQADGVLIAIGRSVSAQSVFGHGIRDRIEFDRGRIVVDEHFETAVSGIFAVGDCIGGVQLAHAATAEGYQALTSMFPEFPKKNLSVIPGCVYTDPEIACAGMTAEEAKAAGIEAKSVKYLMSTNGKSVLTMQERGFIKLIVNTATEQVIGGQLMCARATDMIGMLVLAIDQGMTMGEVAEAVLPHPTFCEGIGEAAEEGILTI